MILELFLAMLALSVVVVFLGYYTDDEPYLPVGLFFFFLLSMIILTGNLQYKIGETRHLDYNYSNSSLASDETMLNTYATWSDQTSHWIGWSLAMCSIAGFALSLFNMRRGKGDKYIQD